MGKSIGVQDFGGFEHGTYPVDIKKPPPSKMAGVKCPVKITAGLLV
jgi:hypothetical protein